MLCFLEYSHLYTDTSICLISHIYQRKNKSETSCTKPFNPPCHAEKWGWPFSSNWQRSESAHQGTMRLLSVYLSSPSEQKFLSIKEEWNLDISLQCWSSHCLILALPLRLGNCPQISINLNSFSPPPSDLWKAVLPHCLCQSPAGWGDSVVAELHHKLCTKQASPLGYPCRSFPDLLSRESSLHLSPR